MDPIAPHSASISAYMSVHEATNLAYVKYFGKKNNATKATFKSLDSTGFTVEYTVENKEKGEIYIPFQKVLTKREEIRPVLESMAKEAEEALGWPSSLSGPPPFKAIAKAIVASTMDIYTPNQPQVPLNSFYLPSIGSMMAEGVLLGSVAIMSTTTDNYLRRQFPAQVLTMRNTVGLQLMKKIGTGLVCLHVAAGAYTLISCYRRGWYNTVNTIKWTISSLIFGAASLGQFKKHAKHVRGEETTAK